MEPFVPPSSLKKEVISDESNDDDISVLETAPTACDQQTKQRKLTPEEANGQTLTDRLAFYFISLEINCNTNSNDNNADSNDCNVKKLRQ